MSNLQTDQEMYDIITESMRKCLLDEFNVNVEITILGGQIPNRLK